LRSYFEPSADEEASGLKQPTKAHRAAAALVKSGHIRVIITTNFDRLMERALEAAGVSPIVISTADAVEGAVPLTHAACTVIKVHGDYLDVRIRNTPEELAQYDRRVSRLLDRVFDEYGLLVCGWSSEWDAALRETLFRCKSRRYTTYWAARGALVDAATRLVEHRRGEVIGISDADRFFDELHQKIASLASLDPPHPLSTKTAVATVKRLLSDERHRIDLNDLVMNEVERVMAATSDQQMPLSGSFGDVPQEIRRRLRQYEALTAVLLSLFATGGQWGGATQGGLWRTALERLANRSEAGGLTLLIGLRRYPALLTLYAGGLAAVASSNFPMLRALLLAQLRRRSGDDSKLAAVERLYPQALLDSDVGSTCLTPGQRRHTPLNDHLFGVLRDTLRSVLPSDDEYAEQFDRFEYLLALVYVDLNLTPGRSASWCPVGRFGWRDRWDGEPPVLARLAWEAEAAGDEWPAIKSGLFASLDRFKALAEVVAGNVTRRRWGE
jgi:hypothetical protein